VKVYNSHQIASHHMTLFRPEKVQIARIAILIGNMKCHRSYLGHARTARIAKTKKSSNLLPHHFLARVSIHATTFLTNLHPTQVMLDMLSDVAT
jgi:hypothetical protein